MDISELYQIYQKHPVITTDSRDCPEGSIFLALKGASFDGNKFAAMALEKGCAYAIVDEKEYAQEGNERFILVEDCLTTFKELAREHRRHFNIPVVGITGTNGKTTTKELVSAVLGEKYNVMFTQGNFNNDVGVPKTLFRLSPEHEIRRRNGSLPSWRHQETRRICRTYLRHDYQRRPCPPTGLRQF